MCCAAGVALFAGAKANLMHCTLSGGNRYGVSARGPGSFVSASDCDMSDNSADGAYIYEEARATLHDCTALRNEHSGCWFTWSATGEVTRCTMSHSKTRHGLHVSSPGSRAAVVGSSFASNADGGIALFSGGVVDLKRCRFGEGNSYGLSASGEGSHATAVKCSAAGNLRRGVYIYRSAKADIASDCVGMPHNDPSQ